MCNGHVTAMQRPCNVESLTYPRHASLQMAVRCDAAAEKCEAWEVAHPISLPLMLGQELMLRKAAQTHVQSHKEAQTELEQVTAM